MPPEPLIDSIAVARTRAQNRTTKERLPLSFIRELTENDLPEILNQQPNRGADPYNLQRIRARHHLLAMSLAKGAKDEEASFVTGYDVVTIRNLRRSPAFIELLSYYQEQQGEIFEGFAKQAAAVGMEALSIMQERMEDEPDAIKFTELANLAEMLFDRTILPSKAAKGAGQAQAPVMVQPITMIQFVDSPHAAEPGPKTIEGQARRMVELNPPKEPQHE